MVRLKDPLRTHQANKAKFQFLMVRLKASHTAAEYVGHAHFNSLWFD